MKLKKIYLQFTVLFLTLMISVNFKKIKKKKKKKKKKKHDTHVYIFCIYE